ncbi:hypothetical protein Tco_0572872 [Tanacetum coccineum]
MIPSYYCSKGVGLVSGISVGEGIGGGVGEGIGGGVGVGVVIGGGVGVGVVIGGGVGVGIGGGVVTAGGDDVVGLWNGFVDDVFGWSYQILSCPAFGLVATSNIEGNKGLGAPQNPLFMFPNIFLVRLIAKQRCLSTV